MITIAVADFNLTFCQGLKTMLEQVEDFRVVILPHDNFRKALANEPSVGILLADDDLFQSWYDRADRKKGSPSTLKTVILTMDRNDLICHPYATDIIYKGSGKREFERLIRNLSY